MDGPLPIFSLYVPDFSLSHFTEDQAFSTSYDLAPPPPPPPLLAVSNLDQRHKGRLRQMYNLLTWDGGGGGGAKSYDGESIAPA